MYVTWQLGQSFSSGHKVSSCHLATRSLLSVSVTLNKVSIVSWQQGQYRCLPTRSVLSPGNKVNIVACRQGQYCLLATRSISLPADKVSIVSWQQGQYRCLPTRSVLSPGNKVNIVACRQGQYCLLATRSVSLPARKVSIVSWQQGQYPSPSNKVSSRHLAIESVPISSNKINTSPGNNIGISHTATISINNFLIPGIRN